MRSAKSPSLARPRAPALRGAAALQLCALLLLVACATLALPGCKCGYTDGEPVDAGTDADGDGYVADDDGSGGDDCDDSDADVHPGAVEVCNGIDDDCDGLLDEDVQDHEGWLCDADGDGFYPGNDCDDSDPDVFPGAAETCDGTDEDCDGLIDEDVDADGDGEPDCADDDGDGYSPGEGDCDDSDATLNPGADEPCDFIDNDCDGLVDEESDYDGDGTPDCGDDCPVYVDVAHADSTMQDGTWTWPFDSVQAGMDQASANGCRFVDVYPGTYVETIDFSGWDLDVVAVGGRSVTVLDGNQQGSVVVADSGEPATALIQGFTITGGEDATGAGIDVKGSSATALSSLQILDNEITGNVATGCESSGSPCGIGGGIRLLYSASLVLGNFIHDNDAAFGGPENGSDGGGIAIIRAPVDVVGNTIVDNTAGDGGGIWVARSDAYIANNVVAGNVVADEGGEDPYDAGQGGGVNIQSSTAAFVFTNNLVTDNEAEAIGGGVCVYEYVPENGNGQLVNNTIVFNRVGDAGLGSGLAVWVNTAPDVRNNVIAFNEADGVHTHASALDNEYGTAVTYAYNGVHGNDGGNWTGAMTSAAGTNANVDPQFVSAPDGDWGNDFQLTSGSAARDAGDPAESYEDVDGSRNDLGCFGGPQGSW